MLESHRARSSFMGSRLASCRLESHWWYCCMSVSPGPQACLGLGELYMVPYRLSEEWKTRQLILCTPKHPGLICMDMGVDIT